MKKIVRAIVVFLVSMLLLSGIVSGLALLPPVQSYLGRKVAAIVSENIPQDISIDSIRITPSGSVDLTGIKLEDHHRDTMIYIPRISARLSFWGLLSGQLRISRAEIKDPLVNIVKYSGEERDNLSLFISNFSRRRDDKAGKKELRLFALQTGLHGGKASYRDLNKPDSSLRYSLEHIKIKASRISVVKNDIHFDIDSLAMDSSLGTDIKNISGLFRFCPKGIIADRINITTGRSRLEFSAAAYFRDTTDSTLTLAEKLKASEMSPFGGTLAGKPRRCGIHLSQSRGPAPRKPLGTYERDRRNSRHNGIQSALRRRVFRRCGRTHFIALRLEKPQGRPRQINT